MRNTRFLFTCLLAVCLPVVTAAAQGHGSANIAFRGGNHEVTVTWHAARDTLARYRVFRATDSASAGTDISGVLVKTTTFVDKTLTPGTLYFYSVEMSSPTAGPTPLHSAPQRFTLAKAPIPLPLPATRRP